MRDLLYAFLCAVQFLTRIPVPTAVQLQPANASRCLMLFPLVGWMLGLFLYGAWWLIHTVPVCSPLLMAACIIVAETIVTGAFHLDGLADTADAFLAPARSPQEKLAIMKDSRIGVMGATALVLAILLKIMVLADVLQAGRQLALVLYPVAGRWTQVALYAISPYVRQQGIGSLFAGAPSWKNLAGATLFLVPFCTLPSFIFSLPALLACVFILRLYFHRQIGGITGDTLGCATVVSEIVLLLAFLLIPA
jgi:adenosylcobinamide-GDP ribazoletransferase